MEEVFCDVPTDDMLEYEAGKGNTEVVRHWLSTYTFSEGAKLCAAKEAIQQHHKDTITLLVKENLDINKLIKYVIDEGLHWCLDLLHEKCGANFNQECSNGDTFLMHAAFLHQTECMQKLLRFGVNPNEFSSQGDTALTRLVCEPENYNTEIQLLLDEGADVNLPNMGCETALLIASYHGITANVQTLLNASARLDIVDSFGETPLMKASQEHHSSIVDILLNDTCNGCSVIDWQNTADKTALKMVFDTTHTKAGCKVANMLVEKSANVDLADEENETTLSASVMVTCMDCVELILTQEPDMTRCVDAVGRTPFLQSIAKGCPQIAQLLVENSCSISTSTKWQNRYSDQVGFHLSPYFSGNLNRQNPNAVKLNLLFFGAGGCIPLRKIQNPLPIAIEAMNKVHTSLMEHARQAIRTHMLYVDSTNLIKRVPLLPIPTCMQEYLLFRNM